MALATAPAPIGEEGIGSAIVLFGELRIELELLTAKFQTPCVGVEQRANMLAVSPASGYPVRHFVDVDLVGAYDASIVASYEAERLVEICLSHPDFVQELALGPVPVLDFLRDLLGSVLDDLGEGGASRQQDFVATLDDVQRRGRCGDVLPVLEREEVDFHGWRGAGTLSQARSFSSWHATASPQPV